MTDVAQLTVPVQRWIARHRHRESAPPLSTALPTEPPTELPRGIRLHRRRDHQLGACTRLLGLVQAETHYPASRPSSLREWLADPALLDAWVAERQGEVLGHVALGPVGEDAVSRMRWREVTGRPAAELGGVSRLFVRPRARGQGIGTALLAIGAEDVRARGLTPVAEVVSPSREGLGLFEQQGWRLVGRSATGRRGEELTTYLYLLPPAVMPTR
jgi:GNAT superfamily N-acetyltransferase